MICLKNRTFAVSQTSLFAFRKNKHRLWFAWKIVLLQYHKHPVTSLRSSLRSCDLLEKSYFCSITNIYSAIGTSEEGVVICLKNRTFAVSQTSYQADYTLLNSCDLLEKSYFCSITNIDIQQCAAAVHVVIWLKNRSFAVSQTSLSMKYATILGCDLLEKSYFCSITNIGST